MSRSETARTKADHKVTKSKVPKTKHTSGLKAHHAKPYRKRHISLLAISLSAAVVLAVLVIATSLSNKQMVKSAKDLISNTLNLDSKSPSTSNVSSNYGFSLDYDPQVLYASAVESITNKLFVGEELGAGRNYSAIRIGQSIPQNRKSVGSGSVGIEYHYTKPTGASSDLEKLEQQLFASQNSSLVKKSSSTTTISGQPFLRSEWSVKPTEGISSSLSNKQTSYTGVINGAPLTAIINYGVEANKAIDTALDSVVQSLKFNSLTKPLSAAKPVDNEPPVEISLLDRLTLTGQVSAAKSLPPSSSEKLSTVYGPSVVKIYNIYCMDITLSGQLFMQDVCSGMTGSGFFIGDQGNIATNGHVAVNSPLDIAISFAYESLSKGDSSYINSLARAARLTDLDLVAATTQQERVRIITEKLYTIPESILSSSNKTENILVGLGQKTPDIDKLVSATKLHQVFPEEDSIKHAKLVAYDYRAIDGASTGSFKASDVAILKLEGSGFPSTRLGNINSLTQGSGLNIMGYPAYASSNQLVEAKESRATLTSGKVSSIKSATGSSSQLIETDATIGHGSSGGPAFNDSGEVVGIATYTIDGSGDGNGIFNYIRDIADLNSLASKNSVNTSSLSQTQNLWQAGVDYFYQAKYSKALTEFASVKSLYAQHPKVDQLAELAKQKIASGEEAKDLPAAAITIGFIVLIIFIAVSILLIVRHHKKHRAYKEDLDNLAAPSPSGPASDTTHQSVSKAQQATPGPVLVSPSPPMPSTPTPGTDQSSPPPPPPPSSVK